MYQLLIVFIIFISTLFATETELKKTSIFIECHFCNEDFIKIDLPFSQHQAPVTRGFLFGDNYLIEF